jgi:chromosome segregation ATPase
MAEDDELDDLFALHRTEIVRLKAELAEARAQIAAKDAEIEKIAEYVERAGADEQDLRAQIAAKDAALRAMRVYVQRAVNQFYNTESAQEDLAAIDAALAAPAREAE